jgi:16S rRNA C967 or C1407 C5-methylase (RsmB/RsmF family)
VSKKTAGGAVAFESWYLDLFGARWPALRAALLEPVRHAALSGNLVQPYYLDPGSVEAALALPVPESGEVLDMCAAPGGKSLVIANRLPAGSTLTANEFSRERRSRLLSVLDEHLPPEIRSRVTVTGRDAARWSRYEQGRYDSILLDAPCSSERHVLSAPAYLDEWSPARIRNLALRQWALLSGAWLVLKPGGYLLYSTCALSPAENDDVVARLAKKYDDVVFCDANEIVRNSDIESRAEARTYGRHVLPDTADGSGPLYYALMRKTESVTRD